MLSITNGWTCVVQLPNRTAEFTITSVKPYLEEEANGEQVDEQTATTAGQDTVQIGVENDNSTANSRPNGANSGSDLPNEEILNDISSGLGVEFDRPPFILSIPRMLYLMSSKMNNQVIPRTLSHVLNDSDEHLLASEIMMKTKHLSR